MNAWKISPLDAVFKKNGPDSILHGPAPIYMASPSNPHFAGDCLRIDYSAEGPIDAEALAANVAAEIAATAEAKYAELPSVSEMASTETKLARTRDSMDRINSAIGQVNEQLAELESTVPADAASQIVTLEAKKSQLETERGITQRLLTSLQTTRDRLAKESDTAKRNVLAEVTRAKRAALASRRQELVNALTKTQQSTLAELAAVVAQLSTI